MKNLLIVLLLTFSFDAGASGISSVSNYNPSAVAITGGTINGATTASVAAVAAGSAYNPAAVAITGGTINGATTASVAAVAAGSAYNPAAVAITGGTISGTTITGNISGSATDLSGTPTFFAPITNSIAADVILTNQNQYYTGPIVAQGTTGTWFASGTVSLGTSASGHIFRAILTDGSTIIASTTVSAAPGGVITLSLSGFINSPIASIYIAVANTSAAGSTMYANSTTYAKDSTLTAFRIK